MVDLVFDDEGPREPLILATMGLGNGEKFTLLEVGLGVGGMFMLTKSSLASSRVLGGICNTRFCRLHGWSGGASSIISVESPPCERITKERLFRIRKICILQTQCLYLINY